VAFSVLHRQHVPRHPPRALSRLSYKVSSQRLQSLAAFSPVTKRLLSILANFVSRLNVVSDSLMISLILRLFSNLGRRFSRSRIFCSYSTPLASRVTFAFNFSEYFLNRFARAKNSLDLNPLSWVRFLKLLTLVFSAKDSHSILENRCGIFPLF
jgi:hypothetical protein